MGGHRAPEPCAHQLRPHTVSVGVCLFVRFPENFTKNCPRVVVFSMADLLLPWNFEEWVGSGETLKNKLALLTQETVDYCSKIQPRIRCKTVRLLLVFC